MIDDPPLLLVRIDEPMPSKRIRLARSIWLSRLLVTSGFIWISWLFYQESYELLAVFSWANIYWLGVSLILGTLSLLPNGLVFYILLNAQANQPLNWSYTLKLHFVGQMVRHVPGRFWGVIYHISEVTHIISPTSIIKVNIDYTFIFLAFNIIIPLAIYLAVRVEVSIAIIVFIFFLFIVTVGLRMNWIYPFLRYIVCSLPTKLTEKIKPYLRSYSKQYSWKTVLRVVVLLGIAWIFYLLAWQSFRFIFPDLTDINIYLLCASYAIAWSIGFLSMITPSGLGVRETVFVFFVMDFGPIENTVLLAIFVRIWLLLIDIILGTIFMFAKLNLGEKHDSTSSSQI